MGRSYVWSFEPGRSSITINATPAPTAGVDVVAKQTFTIPADRLGGELWVVTIQRQGAGASYSGDVILYSVALTYEVVR